MKRQVIRMVAGANLVAGCLLLQGCGIFGKKPADQEANAIPEDAGAVPGETTPVMRVETAPVELPVVASTTPYTIQKGDTLSGIAYKYSLRWQDVVAVNPGITPTRLRIGQLIQLPGQVDLSKARHVPVSTPKVSAPKTTAPKASAASGPAVSYTVKSGDSLSVIAYKHGVKTAAIREANALKSDRIVVGQKLKIPGAKKAAEAAPAAQKAVVTAPKTSAPKATSEVKPVSAPAATTASPVESAPVAIPASAPAGEAAPVMTAPADSNVQTYTVKEGEDLYAVAIRWGVSPSDLKALNNLTSTEVKAGTVLKIPGGVQ
jgi:LysM repeat protein